MPGMFGRVFRSKAKPDRSYTGNIIRDIHLYSTLFRNFRCKFVLRQCDRVVDVLANFVKDIQQESWLE